MSTRDAGSVHLRMSPIVKDRLRREAEALGLELSGYIRMLLATHPKRKR